MDIEASLREETRKWTERIETEMKAVRPADPGDPEKARLLENVRAYVRDSRHFEAKGDLIRGFEAIIWAWANLELGLQLGILERVSATEHGNRFK